MSDILTPAEKTERVIQRLEAEVEQLRGEIDRLAKFFLRNHPDWIGDGGAVDNAIFRLNLQQAESVKLKAEVERLQETLRAKEVGHGPHQESPCCNVEGVADAQAGNA